MRLLFLHGAGGFETDRALADALGAALDCPAHLPHLPDDDMTVAAWAAAVRAELDRIADDDLVAAHSFGATILLHVLAENPPRPVRASLLATPDWSPAGWDVAQYAFTGPEPGAALTLHHCRDDPEVPFDHLARNRAVLPTATVREYPSGGHQFDGLAGRVAADLR